MKRIVTILVVLAMAGGAWAAATPEQKCQTAKLKALGKVRTCLAKQKANVIVGKADVSAECMSKFQAAKDKADAKATAAATACRYIDNGDGTVSDLNTGLMWEKKDDLGGIHDKDNGYAWSVDSSPYPPNGTLFMDFLYRLNGGTSSDGVSSAGCFNGHCDWRIPTIAELQAISLFPYPCSADPCIDPVFGPTQSYFYWSATTFSGNAAGKWAVFFRNGSVQTRFTLNILNARAVRGGL